MRLNREISKLVKLSTALLYKGAKNINFLNVPAKCPSTYALTEQLKYAVLVLGIQFWLFNAFEAIAIYQKMLEISLKPSIFVNNYIVNLYGA